MISAFEAPKKKISKSRKGCHTCKRKRLKCDETKPSCLKCVEKKIVCGGYATNFKWKSFNDEGTTFTLPSSTFGSHQSKSHFNDSNTPNGTHLGRNNSINGSGSMDSPADFPTSMSNSESVNSTQSHSSNNDKVDKVLKKHLELASLSVTGKSIQHIKVENDLISQGINPNTYSRERHASFDIPITKKSGKRSYSEFSEAHSETKKPRPRSKSTNSPIDIQQYRSQVGDNALSSLADAAIDEINSRSPDPPAFAAINQPSPGPNRFANDVGKMLTGFNSPASFQSPFSPGFSDFLNSHHTISTSIDRILPSLSSTLTLYNSNSGGTLSNKQLSLMREKEKLTNGPSDHGLLDLNLSPSLSALINYAFTNNDKETDESKLGSFFDISLSPKFMMSNRKDASPAPVDLGFKGVKTGFSPVPSHGIQIANLDQQFFQQQQQQQNQQQQQHEQQGNLHISNKRASKPPKSQFAIEPSPIDFSNASSPVTEVDQALMRSAENEQILHLYSHYTCLIMSIKNGPNENPWRTLIIPLSTVYPCLFNSIAAMTLFHLAGMSSTNSPTLRARGYSYMKKCILELASGLTKMNDKQVLQADGEVDCSTSELPSDIALTTCINLAVSECWDRHTSSGIAHLKGAKSMIQKVLKVLKNQQINDLEKYNQAKKDNRKLELLEQSSYGGSVSGQSRNSTGSRVSVNYELRRRLVTVDEIEWERIIEDSSDKLGFELPIQEGSFSLTIPRNLQFLFNAWIYFEVLAQMTTDVNQDDKGIDLVATITSISEKTQKRKSEIHKQIRSSSSSVTGSDNHSDNISENLDNSAGSFDYSSSKKGHGNTNSNSNSNFNFFDHIESFNFNNDQVDPLLGCAQSLFSIMGKVATLISLIRRSRWEHETEKAKKGPSNTNNYRNSLSTITLATQLRQQLLDWKPVITSTMMMATSSSTLHRSGGSNEDNEQEITWDMSSCIATAEAYRYSTLLHLHQAVPEIPSLSSHQLAEKVFILLASIPLTSNIYVVHIFPLLVSSCEAEQGDEREWCLSRWSVLAEKMWIGNIDRAIEVVKEVWRRKDGEHLKRTTSKNKSDTALNMKSRDDKDTGDRVNSINEQLSGLMAAINHKDSGDRGGIHSPLHWSAVMKEWGWELLLA